MDQDRGHRPDHDLVSGGEDFERRRALLGSESRRRGQGGLHLPALGPRRHLVGGRTAGFAEQRCDLVDLELQRMLRSVQPAPLGQAAAGLEQAMAQQSDRQFDRVRTVVVPQVHGRPSFGQAFVKAGPLARRNALAQIGAGRHGLLGFG